MHHRRHCNRLHQSGRYQQLRSNQRKYAASPPEVCRRIAQESGSTAGDSKSAGRHMPAGGDGEDEGCLDDKVEQHRAAPVDLLCLCAAAPQILWQARPLPPHQQRRCIPLRQHSHPSQWHLGLESHSSGQHMSWLIDCCTVVVAQ